MDFQEILAKPIRELGLKLEGSPLERFVQQLYRELEAKGSTSSAPSATSPTNGDVPPASPSSAFRSIWPTRSSPSSSGR